MAAPVILGLGLLARVLGPAVAKKVAGQAAKKTVTTASKKAATAKKPAVKKAAPAKRAATTKKATPSKKPPLRDISTAAERKQNKMFAELQKNNAALRAAGGGKAAPAGRAAAVKATAMKIARWEPTKLKKTKLAAAGAAGFLAYDYGSKMNKGGGTPPASGAKTAGPPLIVPKKTTTPPGTGSITGTPSPSGAATSPEKPSAASGSGRPGSGRVASGKKKTVKVKEAKPMQTVSQSRTMWVKKGEMVGGQEVKKGYLAQYGRAEKKVSAKVKIVTPTESGKQAGETWKYKTGKTIGKVKKKK